MFQSKFITIYFPQAIKQQYPLGQIHEDKAHFMHNNYNIIVELAQCNIPSEISSDSNVQKIVQEKILSKIQDSISQEIQLCLPSIKNLEQLSQEGLYSTRIIYERIMNSDQKVEKYNLFDDKEFMKNNNPIRRVRRWINNIDMQNIGTLEKQDLEMYSTGKHLEKEGRYITHQSLTEALNIAHTIYSNWPRKVNRDIERIDKKI